jgi:hypothetical protein
MHLYYFNSVRTIRLITSSINIFADLLVFDFAQYSVDDFAAQINNNFAVLYREISREG